MLHQQGQQAKQHGDIFHLIHTGNETEIRQLLNEDASHQLVDMQNEAGDTPLMVAIMYKKLAIMKIILEYKPNLAITNKNGRDAKLYATCCNDLNLKLEMLSLLNGDIKDMQGLRQQDKMTAQAVSLAYESSVLQEGQERLSIEREEVKQSAERLKQAHKKNTKSHETIKTQAFRYLIEENLRKYFYIACALAEGKVRRQEDGIDGLVSALTRVAQTSAPTVGEKMGVSATAVTSAAILVASLVCKKKDNAAKSAAQSLKDAFYGGGSLISEEKIKKVSSALSRRYHDQIQLLHVSTAQGNGEEIRPCDDDTLMILAKHTVARIVAHIMEKKDEFKPRPHFSKEPRELMGLEERCIRAIVDEHALAVDDGFGSRKAENAFFEGKAALSVASVLDYTGIKVELQEEMSFYIHTGLIWKTWHETAGFCFGTLEEVNRRDFSLLQSEPVVALREGQKERVEETKSNAYLPLRSLEAVRKNRVAMAAKDKTPLIAHKKLDKTPCCVCM